MADQIQKKKKKTSLIKLVYLDFILLAIERLALESLLSYPLIFTQIYIPMKVLLTLMRFLGFFCGSHQLDQTSPEERLEYYGTLFLDRLQTLVCIYAFWPTNFWYKPLVIGAFAISTVCSTVGAFNLHLMSSTYPDEPSRFRSFSK